MAEQRPFSAPTVPSNVPNHPRPASTPVHGPHAGPIQDQQQYLQYQRQQQQQKQQQQHSRPMTSHPPSGVQTPPINTGQRPPLSQPTLLPQTNHPPSFQSPVQLTTPQTPQSASAPLETVLRDKVVSLLASTANGCIVELGYPALLAEYQQLRPAYAKLLEECKALRADNIRCAQMMLERREERRKGEENETQVVGSLKARIAQLEKEHDLLRRQYGVLQHTHALSTTDAYKILEAKYNYVLEMLKKHHAPIAIQNQNGGNEVRITYPRAAVGKQSVTENAYTRDVIDLTVESRSGSPRPMNGTTGQPVQLAQAGSLCGANCPQFMQGNSSGPLPTSSSVPLIPNQRPVSVPPQIMHGTQKPLHADSPLIPFPSHPSSSPMVDLPHIPFSSPTSGPVNAGGTIVSNQNASLPAVHSASDQILDVRLIAHSVTRALAYKPASQKRGEASSSHTASSAPPMEQERLTIHLPPRSLSQPKQPQLHAQSLTATRSVHAPAPVPALIHHPIPAAVQVLKDDRHVSSISARSPSIPANAISSYHEKSQVQLVNTVPFKEAKPHVQVQASPRSSADHPTPAPPTPVLAHPEKDTQLEMQPSMHATPALAASEVKDNVKERNVELVAPSGTQTPSPEPSPPSATLLVKDAQPMAIDGNEKSTAAIETRTEDIVMAEGDASNAKEGRTPDAPDTSAAPARAATGEEAEEEEEEVWDDLTDDEDGGKQPVLDCISSIFYDDENDERLCHFCNTRLERLNLPNPRPLFTYCNMRELIMHGKNEHSPIWAKLRTARAGPP